jgi:hypothetical protein
MNVVNAMLERVYAQTSSHPMHTQLLQLVLRDVMAYSIVRTTTNGKKRPKKVRGK